MACVAAITVSAPMGVFDFWGLKRAMARDLATLADVLARNSTAALSFRDAHAAQDVLQALRAEPSVTGACIYTDDGKPFATYVRQGRDSHFVPPLHPQEQATHFAPGRLIQFRDIVLDSETVGTIYIESDLQRMNTRLREYTFAFLATLLVTLALAYLLAARLQQPISRPLVDLVKTAKAISEAADYSIRADLPNRDEFGVLASEFNGMLDKIEERDRELRQHRNQLEQEVASRTAELVTANAHLRQAEEKFRALGRRGRWNFSDHAGRSPTKHHPALAQMHGFPSPEQLLAEVSNMGQQLFADPRRMDELKQALAENGVVGGAEVQVYRRDGTKKWALLNMRAVRDGDGKIVFYEGTVEDVNDRKIAEERVQFLAYHDALTGLPNRALLHDRLAKALASARRHGEKVALLFLDLDRFKIINDSLGHSIGDLLLQEVAERLKQSARAQDTVARIGGDEFLIALTAVKDIPDAAVAAERIMDAMTAEFVVQGHSFSVSCSIGLSIFPEHGADSETLIKNADAAMYCAKDIGRKNFRFFTEDMNAQVVERLTLEHGLRCTRKTRAILGLSTADEY